MVSAEPSSRPAFALLFPGQGSQRVGMLGALADDAELRTTFAEAGDILGEDLWQLAAEGPEERLRLTVNTQPVLLTAGVALWRSWRTAGGPVPQLMAGHSLGEFTALVCAGALDFAAALRLVRLRAMAMQEAVPVGQGAMAAIIGLDDERVEELCVAAGGDGDECVAAVNYNAPGQVAIAGHVAAVERAVALCRAAGARRALPLPVSAPFHSPLMRPVVERLQAALAPLAIAEAEPPVVRNVDADHGGGPERMRAALARQAASPVLWSRSVERIAAAGVTTFLECGPGRVLCGLVGRILNGVEHSVFGLEEPARRDAALRHLLGSAELA